STWITISGGASGGGDGIVTYSVAANPLASPRTGHIFVKGIPFTVSQAGSTAPVGAAAPFGTVDTPANNTTGITGSIGITGWALDDAGVTAVRIVRDAVTGETPGQKFIGNAAMVPGARPDVAAAFPAYPNNTRAGWGYLMLTNFLPNSGNGTFTLYAYADDA